MVTRSAPLLAVLFSASVVVVAVAAAPGCGIDSRSDAFACDPGCPSDRVCVDGWCVLRPDAAVGDGGIDARPGDGGVDAPMCPSVCSSCTAGTCHISCPNTGSCGAPVVCPAGWACDVSCSGDGSCTGGVECAPGQVCTVQCGGTNACTGGVQCSTGRCDVQCDGTGSCNGGVDCAAACQCDTQCAPSACQGGTSCPGPGQCRQNGECVSQSGACQRC